MEHAIRLSVIDSNLMYLSQTTSKSINKVFFHFIRSFTNHQKFANELKNLQSFVWQPKMTRKKIEEKRNQRKFVCKMRNPGNLSMPEIILNEFLL